MTLQAPVYPRADGAVRAVRHEEGNLQRLHRAERPRGAAGTIPAAGLGKLPHSTLLGADQLFNIFTSIQTIR